MIISLEKIPRREIATLKIMYILRLLIYFFKIASKNDAMKAISSRKCGMPKPHYLIISMVYKKRKRKMNALRFLNSISLAYKTSIKGEQTHLPWLVLYCQRLDSKK